MALNLKRAIVTGLGVVSPLGHSVDEFTEGVLTGRSGLKEITAFDPTPFRSPFGGTVEDFDPALMLSKEEIDLFSDPYLQFAIAAARSALENAGLSWTRETPPDSRSAIVVGTCNGGLKTAEEHYRIICGLQRGRFSRRMNSLIRYHCLGKALSYCLGTTGPTWVVTTACSSSTGAIGLGLELVSQGIVDRVLCGGVDALCLATNAGFNALKATSTGRTAPFSMPQGLNLGEGSGFWVIEEQEVAKARGAKMQGEVLGYAFTSDAYHPTAPDPRGDGAFRTMSAAAARASVAVEELGCISAHGTGTDANDRTETRAISKFLAGKDVPVHSFKSQIGHCLGAAGILEATAALVAMQNNKLPATVNFTQPRPGCTLDYVPNTPRANEYDAFLSCNYAFGGNNAGVVVGKHKEDRKDFPHSREDARTVITGGGAVTSLGVGVASLLEGLEQKKIGMVSIDERVSEPTRASIAGLVQEFSPRDIDRRLDFKGMNRISRYATAAARLALDDAGIRVGPKEGLLTGIINGLYVGPNEEIQMRAVIPSGGTQADISSFSQIVANATAGWVSNALMLKGYTTTVSQGADSGLFALLVAHLAIKSKATTRVLAGASDELFSRYFQNYDEIGLLREGESERNFGLELDVEDRRVLGEGAAYVVAEEAFEASNRGASVLGEVVGFGMTTDCSNFYEPNLDPDGLCTAVTQALEMAGWKGSDVGLVTWSPQGNRNDVKILEGLKLSLGKVAESVPFVTSVFNTGLCESVSGTATLAAILKSWNENTPLWPQITGIEEIDNRPLPDKPVPIIAIASSDLGYNLALAIQPEVCGSK